MSIDLFIWFIILFPAFCVIKKKKMIFIYSSLSFFLAPAAIIAMPIFLISMAVFGSDMIMNLVDYDPLILKSDVPVMKVFPRFDPRNPNDTAWVSECYTKILNAYNDRKGGLFTGNYMYPELRLNKIFDRYALTKNYFGVLYDSMLTSLPKCRLGSISIIDAREILVNNGVLVGDLKNSYKFTINPSETYSIDMTNPLTENESSIVNWYSSWCNDPKLQYLTQLYVSPLEPNIFKVVSFDIQQCYMSGSISVPIPCSNLDMFLDATSRGYFYYTRYSYRFHGVPESVLINTPLNSQGIFPSYDNLGLMYWIKDMSCAYHLPIEDMLTVFSSTAIHNMNNSREFLAVFSNFQTNGWRDANLTIEQVLNWPWSNIGYIEDLSDEVRTFANHDSLWEIRRHLDGGYDLYDPSEPDKPSSLPFFIIVALMLVAAATY